jgi:hypothetical protein
MAQENNPNLPPIIIQDIPDDPGAVGLDTSAPEDSAVSLPQWTQNPPTPEVAKQRTQKTQQGLGPVLKKTDEELYQQFLDGKEDLIRKQAATQLDFDHAMDRQLAIQELASKRGAPLQPEEVMKIMDPFSPANRPADPNTVIERAYATNYVSSLNTAKGFMQDNFMDTAKAEMPQQVQQTLDEGSELLTKNQYILRRMQNTEQNLVQNQSWPGYVADMAKTMFQPYVEYKQRGLIGSAVDGIGLGSNLDEAHYKLYQLPMDQFKEQFDKLWIILKRITHSWLLLMVKPFSLRIHLMLH